MRLGTPGIFSKHLSAARQGCVCVGWQMLQNATGVTEIYAFQLQYNVVS